MRGACLGFVVLVGAMPVLAQEKQVAIQTVKYDGLKEIILRNRGKVVYLDFWYNT